MSRATSGRRASFRSARRPRAKPPSTASSPSPLAEGGALTLCEKDGNDIFVGARTAEAKPVETVADKIAAFVKGVILWDASGSAEALAPTWRKKLDALPDTGDWKLITFRNVAETARFTGKTALLQAVDAIVYDGGTDIGAAMARPEVTDAPVLLFTDEIDTLGLAAPQYEREGVVIASRNDAPARTVTVRKLATGEKPPEGVEVKEGTLLATAWAANRVADLASQAESRKEEFLELGRKYGVASSVTSLIVLESLEQYLTHKIEPPKAMSFHDEWARRRAAEDDQIARKEADAEHERDLLGLWKERVEWWNNPIPPKRTPKSGLFDGIARAVGLGDRRERSVAAANRSAAVDDGFVAMEAMAVDEEAPAMAAPAVLSAGAARVLAKSAGPRDTGSAGGGGATITIQPWNPDSPYLKKLADAKDPYAEYLAQRKEHGSAPAFYMDCADWFFKKGDAKCAILAWRILSNMAEFKLEDAAVWRSMGWRLREAGQYDAAVLCFRHALCLRPEEGQSRRDLARVLAERVKTAFAADAKGAAVNLAEAMALLKEAAFTNFARRSGRRSNDRQVSIVALEELNALIAWCDAVKWPDGQKPAYPELDAAYRRDLPVKIRIVLSWDADETDIDLHVLEPDGEEAFYGHRRTGSGGFVSEDVTTGYGPEEYLRKEGKGTFKILTNYFASHQTALTGAATVTATVYTDWATSAEDFRILTLRLDKPKDKLLIGKIAVK